MKRTPTLLALAVAAGLGIVGVTGFSAASFVSASSSTSSVTAASDWTPPTVSVTSPGPTVRGTVAITATAADDRSGVASVQLQVRAAGATVWTTLCTATTAPYSCSWNTAGLADGAYDLQAIATDKAGNAATSTAVRTLVDNLAPTAALTDPGTPLRGVVTLASTVADTHSGVSSVAYQVADSATGTFTTVATATAAPFSAAWDTTSLPYGPRHLRAVATDRAGNTTISTAIGPRLVDNTTRAITLADPGAFLEGTVKLTTAPTSTAPIASVVIQRAPAGSTTWTPICTVSAAPWACSWNTATTVDGSYDLRAVLTDTNGNTATSNVVAGRKVDNVTTPLKALDVQTTNGGTAGRIDRGDKVLLTYGRRVDLATITPGWDGSPIPITLGITKNAFSTDDLAFTRGGTALNLGTIRTNNNYAAFANFNVRYDATMTATTETVNGVARTVVTVEVGNLLSGSIVTSTGEASLIWLPSTVVTGLNGVKVPVTQATESGISDRDF